MIERASFRNFKSLRNVDVDFERLTVFVGPNASGKTSILEGIEWLALAGRGNLNETLSGRWDPDSLSSRGASDKTIEVQCSNDVDMLQLAAKKTPSGWTRDVSSRKTHPADGVRIDFHQDIYNVAGPPSVATFLEGAKHLRLNGTKLAQPSYSMRTEPGIEADGEGLSSVLAFLALNQPDRFQQLQNSLKQIIPTVERIRFNRVPVSRDETELITINGQGITRRQEKEYVGDEILIDFRGATSIPAGYVSEGTMLILGLLSAMLGPNRPRLLLIDDIEQGLHPGAQRKLIPMIREILVANPDLQIIATTHSPFIVDELQPQEVRMTWAGEDGITSCARMDQHPDLDRWKDEMWPGEFWSLVGEQWVAGSQAQEDR